MARRGMEEPADSRIKSQKQKPQAERIPPRLMNRHQSRRTAAKEE